MIPSFFSAKRVAQILSLSVPRDFPFTGITVDTREVQVGNLFIALVGENQDGHAFIGQAIAKGAAGIVHRNSFSWDPPTAAISFPVADTLLAYNDIAAAWRREFSFPILAVAGSAGKTTSKEILASILRGKFPNVHQTKASQNGFTGIPATLLKLRESQQAAVIEVGIDEPNTMEKHLQTVHPSGGLLTSIGPEHLEKLLDLETVAKEEGRLFEYLENHNGFVALNLDDPEIVRLGQMLKKAKVLSYSLNDPKANIYGIVEEQAEIEVLRVRGIGKHEECFSLPLEGRHNALNLLGALTLASMVGLNPTEMRKGLSSFITAPGRSEVHQWRGSVKVYVDTYNANPASVTAAIEMLNRKVSAGSEAWVCLADMLELGSHEEALHRALADSLMAYNIEHVLLFGERMKVLAEELRVRNFRGEFVHFSDPGQLAEALAKRVRPGDRILLKGSRGMRMERVWEKLSPLESLPQG